MTSNVVLLGSEVHNEAYRYKLCVVEIFLVLVLWR